MLLRFTIPKVSRKNKHLLKKQQLYTNVLMKITTQQQKQKYCYISQLYFDQRSVVIMVKLFVISLKH